MSYAPATKDGFCKKIKSVGIRPRCVRVTNTLPSHIHTASSDIKKVLVLDRSTSSSAVSLTTNNMEKSSSAGICNHDWLAIGWRLQSQINAQIRQATLWDTHRSSCSGELRPATDRLALVYEEIIDVLYEQAREVQFAGDNVDTIQDEIDEKHLFQNRKFTQSACVKFWLDSQASVPRQL